MSILLSPCFSGVHITGYWERKPQKPNRVMSTINVKQTNTSLRPADWTRKDIENQGLPRYSADDLQSIRTELLEGAGFVLVDGCVSRGHETVESAGEDFRRFGSALGRVLEQNVKRETLVEIADFSDVDAFDDRGYRSPGELTPHTDPPPMLALFCMNAARSGGENRLVSAESIRNRFRSECPELLSVLEKGFTFYLPNETEQGAGSFSKPIPTLIDGPGGLSCVYYRPYIEKAVEKSGTPLTDIEREALDRFDRYSTDPDLQIVYGLKPGEALILNNYRVLHARDSYEDWPEKSQRRRLLRLWLNADWLPDPPEAHAMRRDPMAAKRERTF